LQKKKKKKKKKKTPIFFFQRMPETSDTEKRGGRLQFPASFGGTHVSGESEGSDSGTRSSRWHLGEVHASALRSNTTTAAAPESRLGGQPDASSQGPTARRGLDFGRNQPQHQQQQQHHQHHQQQQSLQDPLHDSLGRPPAQDPRRTPSPLPEFYDARRSDNGESAPSSASALRVRHVGGGGAGSASAVSGQPQSQHRGHIGSGNTSNFNYTSSGSSSGGGNGARGGDFTGAHGEGRTKNRTELKVLPPVISGGAPATEPSLQSPVEKRRGDPAGENTASQRRNSLQQQQQHQQQHQQQQHQQLQQQQPQAGPSQVPPPSSQPPR
jgi:hypothetical protein